ncbi:MAG: PBP1A family penicillin-binding protein [Deltaproteobacteria bacterium]|jgi:penicillin-binding protein 1A|nr:PBP1A family penicillin-binding protein [Deltaproteobacteria bacterium]
MLDGPAARDLGAGELAPSDRRPGVLGEGQLKGRLPGAWRHPQAWVPREWAFFIALLPFFFWPMVAVALTLEVYNQEMAGTPLEDLKNYQPPTVSFIFAADRTLMAEIYNEHRLVTPLDRIPRVVVEAFLAAEDSAFYQHQGVDLLGVGRAVLANFRAGHTVQGASTITQQMIRSFLLTNEKTYDRKLKEMILAWRAERILTKDDILFLYLNRIYLGRGAYGVESAARMYFGKTIQDVSLGEAALLAGLAQAPGRLQAHLGTARSRERQLYVLRRMVEVGYVSQRQATAAINAPLRFLDRRPNIFRQVAPQFAEVVRIQMSEYLGADKVLNDGLRVYTTLDLKAQAQAQGAVRDGLDALARRQRMSPKVRSLGPDQVAEYLARARASLESRPLMLFQEPAGLVIEVASSGDRPGLRLSFGADEGFMPAESLAWLVGKRGLGNVFAQGDLVMGRIMGRDQETGLLELVPAPPPEIQAALVLMENRTGRVLAMVGGRDFGLEGIGNSDFNRAILAQRQPGSSFKPFVYTAALDNGYTEASVVYDVPVSYPDGPGRIWRPRNSGGGHSGAMTLLDAIRRSVNVVSVKLTEAIGPQTVVDYAKRMGITTDLSPNLSLALGAFEVTLLDMTKAYTTFPNLGSWAWPTFVDRVEDRFGRTIVDFEPYFTEAISPQTAYIMVDMLSTVARSGTGARVGAALGEIPVAGKTGTTNSQADALFIGFTPDFTCGVWVGRETRVSLGPGEQGARTAAPIFSSFMKQFLDGKEIGVFSVPQGVIRQKLLAGDDDELGKGSSFVFKVGEVGRGRVDTNLGDNYVPREGPYDATAQSQEEMDRRLMDYLSGYGGI